MRFAVVAHRRSTTNEALVAAARSLGLAAELVAPRQALTLLAPGDVALGRLDVRESFDGIERGTGELERLVAGGIEVLNPPGALVAAHDKLLAARALRLAGLPHPHTTLLAPSLPAPDFELRLVLKPRFGSWGREVELCATADDLAGVDLLPTRQGFVVLEVNGAVDFRPLCAPERDVFADAVDALLRRAEREPAELLVAAAAGSP